MERFLIVDDHPLFREALQSAIMAAHPAAEIVEATGMDEALALAGTPGAAFDLALLDLSMPGTTGFDGILQFRSRFPRLPLVVVSGLDDPRIVREALAYGVSGFVPKASGKAELVAAIRTVMAGGLHVPADTPGAAVPAIPEDDRERLVERLKTLTPAQFRVLQMIRQGLLNKQIAYELQVGETTVKAHVSEILRKLGVISRTQAVIEASRIDFERITLEPGDEK
ncbi:response regulator transcription factor [Prosthecomicrobium hirschii]|uniref:response regulator transcription factor n=1 Tax=Prosthecodimorpha hirschii TaxID=665126 RepID=UPI00221E82D5|nr:response regulator transcription factor [Prosthecomicrobium hirschii]MCW1841715.1 response regulator transcription factor [Prosthecomicrobium hirschii]